MNTFAAAMLEPLSGGSVVLEEVRVKAVLRDLFAEVEVAQVYRNPEETHIEAVYTFPLPLDGVLLGFELTIGERKLTGHVVEKTEAQERYEDAITDGDAAVLLEQSQPGLFTANVGNLPPGETATIRFTYGLFLRWNGDRVHLMMPTTIAPRYGDWSAAGFDPHKIPEQDFNAEQKFALKVVIQGLLKDAKFNSASHDIRVLPGDSETSIELVGTQPMDRDFVLDAQTTQKEQTGVVVDRDFDRWVALASFRPEIPQSSEQQRRCVKIVVDCSGSMGGDSITQARAALERIVDGLRSDDEFDIIAFGSSHESLYGRGVAVNEATLAKARQFIRNLDANMGGTETGNALEAAYAIKSSSGLPNELLLITDGQIADVEHVIARAEKSDHRIFTVGVGSAVAETFVRQLAENTGGACELVAPREDMAEKIHRHFQRMYMASANNIEVHWPVQPEQSLPETLKTIYTGDTLHVIGWFAEEPAGEVTLKIFLDDGQVLTERAMVQDAVNILLATTDELPSALARMCAARHLSTLEDSKAASDLSVRYQLMSRWADYLVICPLQENEKASDLPELRKVPHVVAAGWHGIGSVAAGSDRMIEIRESAFLSYDGLQFERANRPDTMRGLASLGRAETLDQPTDKSTSIQLIDRLNELSTRSLPNLDELEHWGVPVLVLKTMRDLVNHGVDEREVVATFLHLVADLDVNRTIGRYARRQILKSFKIHTTRASAAEILTDAISRFSDWSDGIRGNSRDASIASFMKLLRFKMKGLGR